VWIRGEGRLPVSLTWPDSLNVRFWRKADIEKLVEAHEPAANQH
jgi:hypothetical protein